jgi:hypothetical protein
MDLLDPELLRSFLNEATATHFFHTLFIFSAAAFVHARKVSKEIKSQFSQLISVVRDDLKAQQILIANLSARMDNLENKLKEK